jgi:iron complex outermembrane recepter protein
MSRSAQYYFCLIALVLGAPALAAQAEPLDEVVVTASLTGAKLGELPASVTVLDARTLQEAGLAHFGDVLGQVPNLFFAGGTSRPRYFQLRGIGELEQYEGAPNPSVGFLIDDIDFSGIAMPAALFDLERAEVLRGPQGTVYGANALAGLISLRSQAPRDEFGLSGELEAGNYGTFGAGLVLNSPIGGTGTAVRIAAHHFESDGFRRNAFLDRSDTNGFDESLLRLRLASHLGDELKLDLTALHADSRNGYDAWSIDNTRVTESDRPGNDTQLTRALALRLEYSGLQSLRLLSISTWATADMGFSFDGDWGNDAFWGEWAPYDFYEDIERDRQNVSQEFRLTSTGEGPWKWVGGLYAMRLTEDYDFLDMYNGEVFRRLESRYRALTLAAYGQVDRQLRDNLTLSMGLRLERRDASYRDSNDLVEDPVDKMAGGHLSLDWQFAAGQSAYALLTRGYKAGGINTGIALPPALRTFDPESLWNAEIGHRYQSAEHRFSARTSLFHMRRFDQQVAGSWQADPEDPLTFILLTDNAARGENLGLESQLDWQALPSLRLGGNVALLRARFLDYTQADRSLDGRDQPHAPHYQLGLTAEWRRQGLFARADWQAVDGFYFSASHDERAPAYRLMNLRIGYDARNWSASLWARNLFNETYAVHGFFFANEPPDWAPRRYVQNGDPRQVGVRVTFTPW